MFVRVEDLRFASVGGLGGYVVLAVHDVSEDFVGCTAGKGGVARDHHEEDYTQTPHV